VHPWPKRVAARSHGCVPPDLAVAVQQWGPARGRNADRLDAAVEDIRRSGGTIVGAQGVMDYI